MRYTALQTRDWNTLLIPNSQVTKSNVVVLGRNEGRPRQMRRHVTFDVDFRHAPGHVIAVVQDAIRATPMRLVAQDPPPFVECMELRDGFGRYGAFYWLTDITDVVDTDLRERICDAVREGRDHDAHARALTKARGELLGRLRIAFRLEQRRAG